MGRSRNEGTTFLVACKTWFYTKQSTQTFKVGLLARPCSTDDVTVVFKVVVLVYNDVGCRETLGVDCVIRLESKQQGFVYTYDLWRYLKTKECIMKNIFL